MAWSVGSALAASTASALVCRLVLASDGASSSSSTFRLALDAFLCALLSCVLTAALMLPRMPPQRVLGDDEYAQHVPPPPPSATQSQLYLDMIKRILLNIPYHEQSYQVALTRSRERGRPDPCLADRGGFSLVDRVLGEDISLNTLSMIGLKRLDNIHDCVEAALADDVPGDLVETGCAKGGACILMRAILRVKKERKRRVVCCDAFSDAKPPPAPLAEVVLYCLLRPIHLLLTLASFFPSEAWHLRLYAKLMRLQHHFPVDTEHCSRDTVNSFLFFLRQGSRFIRPSAPPVGTGLANVRSHFARLGLLDEQVVFVQGFFNETLPSAPVERIAVLRLDGDLYASTMDGLVHLYPKLSPGGFCIVDDYFSFDECRQAVDEYRALHGITAEMIRIDNMSLFWRVPSKRF